MEFKTHSAEKFKDKSGYYVFPFDVLDKTPGGSNLGRIEWHIEPVRGKKDRKEGRYYIEKLLVWASQTRDEKYKSKVFEIPCYSEAISASYHHNGRMPDSFMAYVWRVMFCEIHKMPVFSAYPDNQHTQLKIDVGSSISIDIDFK